MMPLTLVSIFVLIVGVYGEYNLYEFDPQDVLACAISQGITTELLESVTYAKPEDLYDQVPEARCFLACVLRKMGQFTGENDSPVIKDLQEKFGSTPGLDFDAVIEECKTKPGEVDDGTCMKEYKAFTCFAEKLQEVAKRFEEHNIGDAVPEGWEPRMELEDESDTKEEREEKVKMMDAKKEQKKDEKTQEEKKMEEKKADEKSDEKKPEKKADDKKKDDKKKKTEL